VRFEHDGTGCAWFPDSSAIAVSGLGGLYLFNILGE
jgi:hypothetical protein